MIVRFHGPVLPQTSISEVVAAGAPYFFIMNAAASRDAIGQPLSICSTSAIDFTRSARGACARAGIAVKADTTSRAVNRVRAARQLILHRIVFLLPLRGRCMSAIAPR